MLLRGTIAERDCAEADTQCGQSSGNGAGVFYKARQRGPAWEVGFVDMRDGYGQVGDRGKGI